MNITVNRLILDLMNFVALLRHIINIYKCFPILTKLLYVVMIGYLAMLYDLISNEARFTL